MTKCKTNCFNAVLTGVVGAAIGALGYKYYKEQEAEAAAGLGQWEPRWWLDQQRMTRPYARRLSGYHRVQAANRYTPSPVWPRTYI